MTLPAPLERRYLVWELLPGKRRRYASIITGPFTGIRHAAESAATITFDRGHARQVAAVVGGGRGIFVAHGRVPWKRYAKGEKVTDIRFLLEEEEGRKP